MRAFLVVLFYAVHALAPPYPPCGVSVTDAAAKVATFSRSESPQVSLEQAITGNIFSAKFVKSTGSQTVNRRKKRKRVRRVVHRKPPTVWVMPDVVEVFPDWWTAERAAMKTMAAWCVGVAIR